MMGGLKKGTISLRFSIQYIVAPVIYLDGNHRQQPVITLASLNPTCLSVSATKPQIEIE